MKICFITRSVFSLGGVQRVVSVLTTGLSQKNDIEILCTSDKFAIDRNMYKLGEKVKVNIKSDLLKRRFLPKLCCEIIKKINKKTGIINNKSTIKIARRIYIPNNIQQKFIEYINDNNYDIVVGIEGEFSILLGAIKNKIKAKTIGWQHNSYEAYWKTKDKYYYNQDILYNIYLKNLDKYIVLTEHDKKRLKEEKNVDAIRIYNPLSFKSIEKTKYTEKNIISVGRLVQEQKGFDMLILAFSKVLEKHPDWYLTLVGDGPDKYKLLQLVKDLKIDSNVEIKPSTKNIIKEYLNSTIFVSSSRWEGFGLVLTEAMECGLPIIAFNNSGPSEILINEVSGLLVEKNNVDKLADKMNYLIENPEKVKYISENGLLRAEEFSLEKIIDEWDKIIKNLIK